MTPRTLWTREKEHWEALPLAPFTWMSAIFLVSLCVNPLLPFVAYALQRWAAAWNWRDRWASVRTMATPGMIFVCCLLIVVLLDHTHFWVIPQVVNSVQSAWQGSLPGDLSLSPLDVRSLVARLLLFLPLAPGLALLYEYVAPRTQLHQHRILRQSDLLTPPIAPPTAAPPPDPAPAPVAPAPPEQPAPPPKKQSVPAAKQPLHRKKHQPDAGTVEQMTIDSFLAPAAPGAQKPAETKTAKKPSQHLTPPKPPDKPIDWDNVLE